jgi:hypothetical protein
MSQDGRLVLVHQPSTNRFGLADAAGKLKWTYEIARSSPDSIVASTGAFAGQTVTVAELPLLGAGLQGASVLLVRGPRRVLFRFPPSSYVPQQVELPAVQDVEEYTFLSPDGTVAAIIRDAEAADGSGKRRLQVTLFADSGALLGELDLPEWRFPHRLPLRAEFSNPAKYMAISAGPDLYFIEVTR